ncbi:hypothetical protein TMU3MR103_2276 [Tetragenococcus muriaticus 3MR10-3]|uniref:Uncharacterized protein n=1 Tax=Tetragenococcus muriaticus 3MR10-3 TaxID=1302648 RepID=A0A091BX24_9ENTE|nr:hypothetical protein TMU3MR103_2276 [Tetragenococcus muriaticus 3MR10-3]
MIRKKVINSEEEKGAVILDIKKALLWVTEPNNFVVLAP